MATREQKLMTVLHIRELLDERNELVEHYWKARTVPTIAKRLLKSIDRIEAQIAEAAQTI